ncbi:hypothetical protein BDW02DRAFT_576947 [Decorospora gaudefroyi]|uniref:Uncharacterized protein n=1 Tax=Decorospora gaudefroyi TaxID=184978 RepID=A0A6A5KHB4_9PLEO|nr:hypothetical protein BDW02DRAFT_576947 [Decorospora gaudefroyi]
MHFFLPIALLATCTHSLLHHLAVGTMNGQVLYSLEMDDEARRVYMIAARDAAGAASSLALDRSKRHLFSSRPEDGTLTRYSITPTYEFINEGSMSIPSSCNTTTFTTLHLSSSTQNLGIWGTASTGTCSILFGLTSDGYTTIRSSEISGDIHSLAWSPSGSNLHALDSHSSPDSKTSITNFHIAQTPSLTDIVGINVLENVANASKIVAHPTQPTIYLVTRDSNELVVLPLDDTASKDTPTRFKLLPASLDASMTFHTSSLALSASRSTLWTLSQSDSQAVVNAFELDPATGAVLRVAARASWVARGNGEGRLTAATWVEGDVVGVANSPVGYVTVLGLDRGVAAKVVGGGAVEGEAPHAFLVPMDVGGGAGERRRWWRREALAARVMSFGRTSLYDYVDLGESVWMD